jgi:hypothetical protein
MLLKNVNENVNIFNILIFSLILNFSVLPIFSYGLSIFVFSLTSLIIYFSVSDKGMLSDLSLSGMLIYGSQLFVMSLVIFFGDVLIDLSLYGLREMYTHMILYLITFLMSFLGFSSSDIKK